MSSRFLLGCVVMVGCRPAQGVLDDTRGPGALDPIGSGGTGDGANHYEIVVDVIASTPTGGIPDESDVVVSVRDVEGNPLVDLDVDVAGQRLQQGQDPGFYMGRVKGYTATRALIVDGPDGAFRGTGVGPDVHEIVVETDPWDVAQPNTVIWTPADADDAVVTSSAGRTVLDGDFGVHTFDADTLATGLQRISVTRGNTEALAALPGSRFTVAVEVTRDVVVYGDGDAAYGVFGELRVDSDWDDDTATAWVLATPKGAQTPTAFTRIDAFNDRQNYEVTGLGPGEWDLLAYLDLDESTKGKPPDGPTKGDPYDTVTITLDDPDLVEQEMRMERAWSDDPKD